MSKTISYTEAREHLKTYLDYVAQNNDTIIIKRNDGKNVVLVSEEDYNSMDETDYLLSTDANKNNLLKSIESIEKGDVVKFESFEDFKKHYGL